jgi:hypothetical protein
MDIAALSINLNQAKVAQQASIAVMKMAMDTAKQKSQETVNMIEANTKTMEIAANPNLGRNLDARV